MFHAPLAWSRRLDRLKVCKDLAGDGCTKTIARIVGGPRFVFVLTGQDTEGNRAADRVNEAEQFGSIPNHRMFALIAPPRASKSAKERGRINFPMLLRSS